MTNTLMLLTPVVVFIIVAVFSFTGCTPFSAADPEPVEKAKDPPPTTPPTVPPTVPPVVTPTTTASAAYQDAVSKTAGFAALWPLNETGGNVANVVGPLNPAANGLYLPPGAPAATGYKLGQDGLQHAKDTTDFAPTFDGTTGHVEVQFNGPLNPDNTVPGFTLELWIKPNPNLGPSTQTVISSHRFDSAGVQQGYEIALIRNVGQPIQQIRGRVFGGGTMTEMLVSVATGAPDEWRYVVMIYEPSMTVPRVVSLTVRVAKTIDVYKDGPHKAAYDAVTAAKPSTLRFGAGHAMGQGTENPFAGQIDNVAFYNVALPQADMDKHFGMF